MKTYLFDTLNRFRRFSENLDVKATLCNKPWQVFNDSGEKELYIFQEDGTLLITYSGRVTHGTWQYLAANKSIVISAGEQSYMVHPAFMDNVLFALQVDGTNECAFLIDENNAQNFAPRSYTALMGYFEEKERRILETIEMQKRVEQGILRDIEQEKDEKENQKWAHVGRLYRNKIEGRIDHFISYAITAKIIGFCVVVCLAFWYWMAPEDREFIFTAIIFLVPIGGLILQLVLDKVLKKFYLKCYIRRHPNDWEIPYLLEWHNAHVEYSWQRLKQEDLHELLHGK